MAHTERYTAAAERDPLFNQILTNPSDDAPGYRPNHLVEPKHLSDEQRKQFEDWAY